MITLGWNLVDSAARATRLTGVADLSVDVAQTEREQLPVISRRTTVEIMTRPSGAASRAAAVRTADDLMAHRAAQLREHERELHRLVTDYHHAAAQAAMIRADAEARAAKITADAQARIAALNEHAQTQAAAFEDAARAAVHAILQSGEPRESVARLTGLSRAQVRAAQRTTDPTPRTSGRDPASNSRAASTQETAS